MDLVNRLKFFMESNDIAISQFADTCHIPRPTMSQILNGRNKKISDELISKIHNAYPELSVLWLMFGEGEMISKLNMRFSSDQNYAPAATAGQLHSDKQPVTTQIPNIDTPTDSVTEKYRNNSTQLFFQQTDDMASKPNNISPDYVLHDAGASEVASSDQAVIDFEHIMPTEPNIPSEKTSSPSQTPYNPNRATYFQQNNTFNTSPEPQNNPDSEIHVSPTADNRHTTTPPMPSESNPKSEACNISLQTPPNKRITNIVVFYSDNSFQSFNPATLSS